MCYLGSIVFLVGITALVVGLVFFLKRQRSDNNVEPELNQFEHRLRPSSATNSKLNFYFMLDQCGAIGAKIIVAKNSN